MDLRKWAIRPEGAPSPDYESEKEFRFTVEMHYDGLLTSDDYEFGAVAFCDRVDPDYFSLIELMTMAERVGVQEEYYQFLWAKPGQEIKDELQTIDCEADILTCLGEDGLNGKHHLLKVFVKKMTRLQAWRRMVDIQKQLCGVVPAIGDGFRLEGLTPLEWMQRRQIPTWCKFKMMKKVHVNYQRLASLDPEALCPNAWVRLRERKQPVAYCYPTLSGYGQYEVREGLRSWVVDLRLFRCACGLWQLSGLPCQHALACIAHNKEAVEAYYDPCYKVASYRAAYRHPIKPLNDSSQWAVSFGPNIRPPTIQRPTSGPKQRKRRLEAGELISRKDKRGRPYNTVGKSGQPQKCTICKKTGHNRRAHGIDQVQMDGGSSSTRPPEQPSQEATPGVRNLVRKWHVTVCRIPYTSSNTLSQPEVFRFQHMNPIMKQIDSPYKVLLLLHCCYFDIEPDEEPTSSINLLQAQLLTTAK
ncbi:hypothetical protein LINPERHAP2_LOCUS35998 [Linum perenne]